MRQISPRYRTGYRDGVTSSAESPGSSDAPGRPPLPRTISYASCMSAEATELSVSQALDRFSDAVNRATFGDEVTFLTRGRGHQRAAAIVLADEVATALGL